MIDPIPFEPLDFARIQFPSDRITFGDIRRAHPERFDVEHAPLFAQADGDPRFALNLILYLERLLARSAYEGACGAGSVVLDNFGMGREECLEDLSKLYATYGVTRGTHSTEQLVRGIESQALAQATNRPR